jgi:carboxyl-terminal processing protease
MRPCRTLLAPLLFLAAACASSATSEPNGDEPASAPPISKEQALATFEAAWSAVDEHHFDPEFNGVDWEGVRAELLPRVEAATTEAEVRSLVREMLGRLGQSHFVVIPASDRPTGDVTDASDDGDDEVAGGLGIDVRLRDGRLLVTEVQPESPAERAGVRLGWAIVSIDGRTVRAEETPFEARQRALRRTWGPIGTSVELSCLDGADEEVRLTLERGERNVEAHDFGTTLPTFYLRFAAETHDVDGRRLGRIHFTNWFLPMMAPINAAVDEMRDLDGIVIDLRSNTGGVGGMVMGVAGHFFPTMTELGVQTMRDSELKYVAFPQRVDTNGESVEPYSGPVAILIDETTASASEVFTGGMQSVGRARVFGNTSAGAVLPARTTILPNGDAVLHAIGDFKTADGTALEGRGVIPDEDVPVRREDLLDGRDAQLEAALAWLAARPANP